MISDVDEWYESLAKDDSETTGRVEAAINLLEEYGPTLGRPVADRVQGSHIHNMKELRPSATNIRILFVFDPSRNAVLLVAGDKSGDWKGWYTTNIPLAEERYEGWLAGDYDEEI